MQYYETETAVPSSGNYFLLFFLPEFFQRKENKTHTISEIHQSGRCSYTAEFIDFSMRFSKSCTAPLQKKKKNLEGIYMTLNLDPLSNALKVITGTSVSVIFKFIA